MSLALWLGAIKSILELVAVGVLGFLVMSYGESRVDKRDLQQLTDRITENGKTLTRWREEESHANTQRDAALAALHAAVAAHHDPIIVRVPVGEARPMPGNPGEARGEHSQCLGTGGGLGSPWAQVDIRPDLDALELKYGQALIDCKAVLDKWPQ